MDTYSTNTPRFRKGALKGVKVISFFLVAAGLLSFQNMKLISSALSNNNSFQWNYEIMTNQISDKPYLSLIPLEELAKNNNITCPDGLFPIENTHLAVSTTHSDRLIPKVVHVTSKQRCATKAVIDNINKWRFENHSLYFHDDDAVEQLIQHPITRQEFPELREIFKCATSGATKSDLWRYAVLYLYGGIYSDIDNSPIRFNGETIKSEDDSFFVIEQLGIMSQYFLASSVGHPLMRQMLETGIYNLKQTNNVMVNNAATTTGPKAVKVGFIKFMAEVGVETTGYIPAGIYVGSNNRSVTVIGQANRSKDYVHRGGLGHKHKVEYYNAVQIRHFLSMRKGQGPNPISCKEHLKRTNGTDEVANYIYVPELGHYIDGYNQTALKLYNLTRM